MPAKIRRTILATAALPCSTPFPGYTALVREEVGALPFEVLDDIGVVVTVTDSLIQPMDSA